jgi:hypothetical protein
VTLVDNVEATSDEVKRELSFLVKAKTFKTPSKRTRYLNNKDSLLGNWEVVKHNRALPVDKEDLYKQVDWDWVASRTRHHRSRGSSGDQRCSDG